MATVYLQGKGSIYFIMKSEMPELVPSQEDSISCHLNIDVCPTFALCCDG